MKNIKNESGTLLKEDARLPRREFLRAVGTSSLALAGIVCVPGATARIDKVTLTQTQDQGNSVAEYFPWMGP